MKRKKNRKIKVSCEFEIREDVWNDLTDDLRTKGGMARAGIYELTAADLVAFAVMVATRRL